MSVVIKSIARSRLLAVLIAVAGALAAPVSAQPQLLVLGTVHFANPGLDQINLKVEDVLAADRQAELERLATALARFRPTHIAVEWEASKQETLDAAYAAWRGGNRANRDERHQIAFRLAERLGLARIDAVDWQRPPPGDEANYDFPAWASAHGQSDSLSAVFAKLKVDTDRLQKAMPCWTVSQWLADANASGVQRRNAMSYYPIARIGDTLSAPGAAWVGGSWHMRNLKIWANLAALAARPDDRVLLVVGAGHRPLIEHFSRDSGSFRLLDPLKWLPKDKRACRAK